MTRAWFVFAALAPFVLIVAPAHGQEGDVKAGQAKAQLCAACHGPDGVSHIALTPSLAGQPDEYVQWQLVYFRSGARKSQAMQIIAGTARSMGIEVAD